MTVLLLSYDCRCPGLSSSSSKHPPAKHPTLPSSLRNLHNTSRNNSVTVENNILLSSAAKSKPLDHALELFHLLPDRDTVTWNTAMSACLHHGRFQTALHLFVEMLLCCSDLPDTITVRSVLKACIESNNFHLGSQVHAYITKLEGLCSLDLTVISTCLVNLYCESGSVEIARQVFGRIPQKDIVSFTSLLVGHNQAGEFEETLRIFVDLIDKSYISVNEYALSCALRASTGIPCLFGGRQIHARVVKSSLRSDVFVGTALINMYAKCDASECARNAFLDISEPNVVAWNALIAGRFDGQEVLQLFCKMRLSGVSPDHVTFAGVLRASADISICLLQQIQGLVVKTMAGNIDVFVGGALFSKYMDRGCLQEARKIFDRINDKDIVAFNLAIEGCIRNGHVAEAVNLLHEALETVNELNEATITSLLIGVGGLHQGKQLHALAVKFGYCDGWDKSISSSLIRIYSKYHCLDDAIRLFDHSHSPDLVLWTSLISGFCWSGESDEALNLYVRMVSQGLEERPNHYTFSCLLHSCANLIAVEEGKQVHAQIIKANPSISCDVVVVSGLLDMYAKCGYIIEARAIFNGMEDRDLASWNAMITSLAQHGLAEAAIETFQELMAEKDLEPNHITLVGVLSACSHRGMVEEGRQYFKSIEEPTIDHYACMINLLARAGWMYEAINLLDEMPFEPNEHIWTSLLAASRIHRNIELGEFAAKHLLELNPKDPGVYVGLSNIYAAAGRWHSVKHIRKLMRDQAARKIPGSSWLRIERKAHVFLTDDSSYMPN